MAILKIKDAEGNVQEILAIKGENYVLTDADKMEIAQMAAALVNSNIPSAEEVEY